VAVHLVNFLFIGSISIYLVALFSPFLQLLLLLHVYPASLLHSSCGCSLWVSPLSPISCAKRTLVIHLLNTIKKSPTRSESAQRALNKPALLSFPANAPNLRTSNCGGIILGCLNSGHTSRRSFSKPNHPLFTHLKHRSIFTKKSKKHTSNTDSDL
jgi:hypothetical protein